MLNKSGQTIKQMTPNSWIHRTLTFHMIQEREYKEVSVLLIAHDEIQNKIQCNVCVMLSRNNFTN